MFTLLSSLRRCTLHTGEDGVVYDPLSDVYNVRLVKFNIQTLFFRRMHRVFGANTWNLTIDNSM
jgi:hypothetical protein